MKFFFDNCISHKIARAMHELIQPRHEAVALRGKFAESTADTQWIKELAQEGNWIIISGDLRISTRPQEREIWRAAKLTTFFMAKGFANVEEWEQVKWMIDKWPLIVKQSQLVVPGGAFVVPKKGNQLTSI